MRKLVSTSEASKLLGLSIQGIHYRIKNKKLDSIKKDGKTFVYIDSTLINTPKTSIPNYDELLKSKDEQIILLKQTIKLIQKQYKKEIKRLDENQNKIINIFKSEIDILKQAYNEMQSLYKITYKNDNYNTNFDLEFIDIQEFYRYMKQYNKTDKEIKTLILDRIRLEDKRFIYNIKTKKLMILKSDFKDLLVK